MTDNRIYYTNQPIQPIQSAPVKPRSTGTANTAGGFDQVLNQTLGGVKFSQHATQRLQTRNINLSNDQMNQLKTAVDKAAQKGSKGIVDFDEQRFGACCECDEQDGHHGHGWLKYQGQCLYKH